MQGKSKPLGVFFKSKYTQAFICYSLMLWMAHLVSLAFGRINVNVYLLLNMATAGIAVFFVGLAIGHWAQKEDTGRGAGVKMALGITSLVLICQVLAAVMVRYLGTAVPIAGDWMTLGLTHGNVVLGRLLGRLPLWAIPPLVLLPLLNYRAHRFEGIENRRLMALSTILMVSFLLNNMLDRVIYGEAFAFLTVNNWGVVDMQGLFLFVMVFVALQALFNRTTYIARSFLHFPLKAYVKHEIDTVRVLLSSKRA